jgi:hypothetical protein
MRSWGRSLAKTPMIAAHMGRDRSKRLRRDWKSAKVNVMMKALRAKFDQHAQLRGLKLAFAEKDHGSVDSTRTRKSVAPASLGRISTAPELGSHGRSELALRESLGQRRSGRNPWPPAKARSPARAHRAVRVAY